MPKKNRTEIMIDKAGVQTAKAVADLWKGHEARIAEAIEESEGRKLNVSFSVRIDFSESVGTVDTHIGYSQVTKDKRHADIDPPDQLQIPGTEREPEPEMIEEQYQDEAGNVVELPKAAKRGRKKKGE